MSGSGVNFSKYLDAIRFCGFLESTQGDAAEAYRRTFPNSNVVKSSFGKPSGSPEYNGLQSAATLYRKSKLVVKILAESEVPLYLMFQGYRYKAVQVLADKMMTAKYDRDRINAADKLLLHLKPPEDIKIDLDIGLKTETVVDQYKNAMRMMVEKQKELIKQGGDLKSITNAKIYDAEVVSLEESNG